MPNHHLLSSWVKNVYNLCLHQPTTRGNQSTPHLLPTSNYLLARAQPTTFTQLLNTFAPSLSPTPSPQLPDTNLHLSPLSTPPTIKKNKKK